MSRFKHFLQAKLHELRRFAREDGQTLVEYGLLAVLLSIAAVAAMTLLGEDVVRLFTRVSSEFQEISSAP